MRKTKVEPPSTWAQERMEIKLWFRHGDVEQLALRSGVSYSFASKVKNGKDFNHAVRRVALNIVAERKQEAEQDAVLHANKAI